MQHWRWLNQCLVLQVRSKNVIRADGSWRLGMFADRDPRPIFKSRLTSLIVQAIDGLPDAAICSFSRAVYRPNVCIPQFPDISTASLHGWPVLLQGILHWSSSSWAHQLDWSKAVKKRSSELPCLKTTFLQPTSFVSRKPLAFVLFREALLSGCQIYHERFAGPIKALIIVLTLTRIVPHVRRRCTFSEKSRIAMAWHVNLYPCNPCTS